MKKTTLYNTHLALNAKMTSFAGYEMPIQYAGIKKEHLSVREGLGVFDVSHMGEFYISGPNALKLLQYVCSNDISKILVGKAQYNYFPNESGGIVDDLIVYRLEEEHYLLVVNASNIEKDWKWIQKHNQQFEAQLVNHSEKIALLAIQGPKALKAMQSLTEFKLESLSSYSHKNALFAGCENVIISTTGYTGAGGLEIYFPAQKAEEIWNAVMDAGKVYNIVPAGLAARDTLRTEMGYCLYGNEINETTSPIAAGLGWVSKPETEFINFENIAKQKSEGTEDKLIGFKMEGREIPRVGYTLVNSSNTPIGSVTSGTQSPSLSKGIGLGYVKKEYSKNETQIGVKIRDKYCSAKVIKPPFI